MLKHFICEYTVKAIILKRPRIKMETHIGYAHIAEMTTTIDDSLYLYAV
jgi:hypothetical protein